MVTTKSPRSCDEISEEIARKYDIKLDRTLRYVYTTPNTLASVRRSNRIILPYEKVVLSRFEYDSGGKAYERACKKALELAESLMKEHRIVYPGICALRKVNHPPRGGVYCLEGIMIVSTTPFN